MIPETVFPSLTMSFEEPDVLVTRVTTEGLITADSVAGVTSTAAGVFETRQDIYWLNFVGKASGLTPDSKPLLKNIPVLRPYAYVGIVESFVTRTWLTVVLRGLVLIGRLGGKIVFVKSEEEARVWIKEDRTRRAGSRMAG